MNEEDYIEQINNLIRRCGVGFDLNDIEALVFLLERNQELKEQLQEEQEAYDIMFSLWNNRKFIRKFNKEFDKEDKIKNPNRDYACIMPDAEEVYKRYYELKQQLQQKEDIINKTKECVEELCDETDDTTCYDITKNRKKILLEILDNKGE